MSLHRVAITGMGVKTPAGQDLDRYWATLLAGRGTAAKIEAFDASDAPVRFACEVHDLDPSAY
ncbi:MAG: beta-ketoacyl synthase N-terminal-like domain-containing protein, partial [Acidimicrobiales bacterium]